MLRKGPDIGSEIAQRLGMRYVVAGPGASQHGDLVKSTEPHLAPFKGEYVGVADKELRRELYANAALVVMPTLYIEPFGGVAVEAMFSGTPVLASPWGAFGETVVEGVSGAHFHTIPEGVEAAKRAMELDYAKVAAHAQRYSIWNVRHEYEQWFVRMDGLWSGRGIGDFYGEGAYDPGGEG
jgi:glycosyltransferase involved in cell wall biosynthesis